MSTTNTKRCSTWLQLDTLHACTVHRREKSLKKEWPELSLSHTHNDTNWGSIWLELESQQESRDQTRASYTEDFQSEVSLD